MTRKILLAIFLVSLLAGCSGNGNPAPPGVEPNIPEQAVMASTDTQGWTRYLAYSRPPSDTVIIEKCENVVDVPDIITPTIAGVVDNGFQTLSPDIYRYYSGWETGLFALDGGGQVPTPGAEVNFDESGSRGGASPPERAVAEPDIYALGDNLLYTLNIYRGLQTIKTASLENPQYGSGIYLPGFPNELYLKGDLVITTVAGFKAGYGWSSMNLPALPENEPISAELLRYLESKVVVVDVRNAERMEAVAELPLDGTLIESRIVGDILYAVTFTSDSIIVSAFNLADAPEIERVDQEIISFPSNWDWNLLAYTHLNVGQEYLFVSVPVANEYYYTSEETSIHCLDISDPSGSINARGVMTIPGHVTDRFKMDFYKHYFRVISGDWGGNNLLTIFDLSDPDAPDLLAVKSVGYSEQLFATRFDGERAYIVTYLRKDPLFVLDLSNPENPMIVGELIVPGWSQYIEPLGDRLVALGVDDEGGGRRAAVSLFSVEDPTNPKLLDKVTVGSDYSTSYGYADYKAFKVMPEENLVMLPWSDYSGFWWWGYRLEDQVTLIDLLRDELKERGSLAHIGTVERPFLSRDRAFILSQSAFQVADIDDRDYPQTLSLMRLLRSAKRIVPAGKFALVEDEENWWEVIKLDHPELKPTARIKVEGMSVNILSGADASYVVRQVETDSEYIYSSEIHRLEISESGQAQVTGCLALPTGTSLYPQGSIDLAGSKLGIVGWVSRQDYYYFLDERTGIMPFAGSDPGWYYKNGVLLIASSDTGEIELSGLVDLTPGSAGDVYSSYALDSGNPLVRGESLYLSWSETTWPEYDEFLYYFPETVTTVYYAARLNLSDPEYPSLFLINIPGGLSYVSEDGERIYYLKSDAEEILSDYGYPYYEYSYSLGACRYNADGFAAGNEIALPGFPEISFNDTSAVILSGTPYYYWYGDVSGGEEAPGQTLSLFKTDDIDNLELQNSVALPNFEAGYNLNAQSGGRVFLSFGPFVNPKRIREMAISQGSWNPEGEEMYAYLNLVYGIEDSGFVLEHLSPSTVWNPLPLTFEGKTLIPSGMYGIEVLEEE